jgi:hypothetical protein
MKDKASKNKKEKGAVMIEAAITMPIILMLLTATYDIGNALNAAFRMQDFARLGLSQLSAQLDLEPGVFVTDKLGCKTKPFVGPCNPLSDHKTVHQTIKQLIVRATDLNIDPNTIEVETTLGQIDTTDIVSIKISGNYTGMFYPFNNLPISLADTGPRL